MEPLVVQATRISYGRIHLQTILEEEEPSTSPAVDKKQTTRISKVRTRLSTLHLLFYLSTTFSAVCLDPPSVSPTQAVFYKECFPYSKHLCITCGKKKKASATFYEYLSLVYYITVFTYPSLPLKLGMVSTLVR